MTRTDTIRIRSLCAPAIVATVAATAALGAGQAQANHVACGDTITADTTLDSDLVNCPNNGIVIGANDVTLDLNGHTVDGDDELLKSCPDGEFCDVGVLNDSHDGVTIEGGSLRQFGTGAFIGRARHNRVLGIASSENVFFGFVLAESARSAIRGSSGSNNPGPEGDGLGVFFSHHLRIVNNAFRQNELGIHVFESTENVIKRNRISRNEGPGMIIERANRNTVRRNRCARNGFCLFVAPGNRNVIARNRVVGGEAGIGIEKGRGNVVARNVVAHPRKVGIYLGLNQPPIGGDHSVVRRNRVRDSGGDGFVVRGTDANSRLNRNVAVGAEDDGFDVESPSAELTGNRALRNGDLGIEAVRGVIDGGLNLARDNGDSRQCTNISCR